MEAPTVEHLHRKRGPHRFPQAVGKQPIAVDICSGLGGLSEGLKMAGFDVRLAIDNSPSALVTYKQNHPETFTTIQDISRLDNLKQLLNAVGVHQGDLALLAGGTPCQSFSKANSRKKPGRNQHHNLVLEFARLVSETRPQMFLLENVPNMASVGGDLLAEFRARVEREGYQVQERRLWAHDYGVPQRRERLFIAGSRIGPVTFMLPSHGPEGRQPHVTVRDALVGDLPNPVYLNGFYPKAAYSAPPANWYQRWLRVGSRAVHDQVTNALGKDVVERIGLIPEGKSWSQIQGSAEVPDHLRIRVDHRSVYRRLTLDDPAVTIVHFRKAMTIHPTQNRLLSLREAARLQSFRDRFIFSRGEKGLWQYDQVQQQLGNAVPPLLARAVGKSLMRRITN